MNSNFHYHIDLNEDQNHQPFFCTLGSSLHQDSSSSSSLSSYLPFLINSQQGHVEYSNTAKYHGDHHHDHLPQPLEGKMPMSNGGSSCDHMVPKKETRLKLTIRKKEERTDILPLQDQTKADQSCLSPTTTTTVKWMSSKMRLVKKMVTNKQPMDRALQEDDHDKRISQNHSTTLYDNDYGNNNGVIRVCSDCNTTKTPLWRSGPRGPKSLCNACGIRQRKARRAAMVAAAAAVGGDHYPETQTLPPQIKSAKKKMQNKNKRPRDQFTPPPPKAKKSKIATSPVEDASESQSKSSPSSSSSSSSKFGFDDLTIILSKSSAFQQVFPQDEKEAAILLMALSYGMVHG